MSIVLLLCLNISYAQKDKDAKQKYKTAIKAFKNDEYYSGFSQANLALNGKLKEKHRSKLIEEYTSSFNRFYGTSLTNIQQLEFKTTSYQGEASILGSESLIKTYEEMDRIIKVVKALPNQLLVKLNITNDLLIDYGPEIEHFNTLKTDFTEQFITEEYDKGLESLEEPTKKDAYNSYGHFRNVLRYQRGYKKVDSLLIIAHSRAIYKVKLNSFNNRIKGTEHLEYHNIGSNHLNSQLLKQFESNQFLVLTYEENYDISIEINLITHSKKISDIMESTEDKTKKVVVKEEEVKNDEGKIENIKIYQEVTGKFTTYSQEFWVTIEGILTVNNNLTNTQILEESLSGTTLHSNSWYGFTGDERVLDKSEKQSLEQKKPSDPVDDDLYNDAAKRLAEIATQKIMSNLTTTYLF